ncbi:SDR family oxidoreductase [Comamonas humi]
MLLKDKVIIVSGIGPGLGARLALRAAEYQAKAVVLAARTPSKLDETEQLIRAAGHGCEIFKLPTDITQPAQCQRLAEQTTERFGRIDALINSAYLHGSWSTSGNAAMDDWRQTMEVNLFGSMNMTQAVVPQMKQQKSGSIVMINTMATRRTNQLEAGYAVSKGALQTAVQYLAEDLGPHGIRVNSTYMGWMWGEPVKAYLQGESQRQGVSVESLAKEVGKDIPLRNEIPDEGDCAAAALYLASDYARVITGAHLDVNGGHYLPH